MKCLYSDEKAEYLTKIIVKLPIGGIFKEEEIEVELYRCIKSGKIFGVIRNDKGILKYKMVSFPLKIKLKNVEYIIPYEVFNKYANKAFRSYNFIGIITCFWTDEFLFYQQSISAEIYWKFITLYIDGLHFGRIPIEEIIIKKLNSE